MPPTLRRALAHRWLVPLLLIAAGIVLRLYWMHGHPTLGWQKSETQNIAIALITTGRFADAFGPGSGLTAHTSPVMPLLIASVYAVFGAATPAAEVALQMQSIALVSLSFALAYRLFGELGASRPARLVALVVVAVLPLQFELEINQIRSWESALTVCLLLAVLGALLRLDLRSPPLLRALILPALGTGLLFLTSLAGGVAAITGFVLLALRRLPTRRWPAAAALLAVALVAFSGPWALRNHAALGRTIWTRSNSGLELSLAYNDRMIDWRDPQGSYVARLNEMHPMHASGRAAYDAAGELSYYDAQGAAARQWIDSHRNAAVAIFLRHVREYLVPPAWFLQGWGQGGSALALRGQLLGLAALLSLAALAVLPWRHPRYLYILLALGALAAPYIVVQPILRYRYLIYALTIFLACDGVARLIAAVRRRAASVPASASP